MIMINKWQLKAMFFGLKSAKTERMIALAEQKTLLEIWGMYEAGIMTGEEFDRLMADMWGDGNG